MTPEQLERFLDKVHVCPITGCWLWTGACTARTRDRPAIKIDGKMFRAYRVAYEHYVGPIPDGLTIDHVKERCAARPMCVNSDHLEPVSARENILRSDGPAATNARKTHCKNGHAFVEGSFYTGKKGNRQCKQCTKDAAVARQAADPEKFKAARAEASRKNRANDPNYNAKMVQRRAQKKSQDPTAVQEFDRKHNKLRQERKRAAE